jgi:hypothetical protein
MLFQPELHPNTIYRPLYFAESQFFKWRFFAFFQPENMFLTDTKDFYEKTQPQFARFEIIYIYNLVDFYSRFQQVAKI